jgi:hypothetical protein
VLTNLRFWCVSTHIIKSSYGCTSPILRKIGGASRIGYIISNAVTTNAY